VYRDPSIFANFLKKFTTLHTSSPLYLIS